MDAVTDTGHLFLGDREKAPQFQCPLKCSIRLTASCLRVQSGYFGAERLLQCGITTAGPFDDAHRVALRAVVFRELGSVGEDVGSAGA